LTSLTGVGSKNGGFQLATEIVAAREACRRGEAVQRPITITTASIYDADGEKKRVRGKGAILVPLCKPWLQRAIRRSAQMNADEGFGSILSAGSHFG